MVEVNLAPNTSPNLVGCEKLLEGPKVYVYTLKGWVGEEPGFVECMDISNNRFRCGYVSGPDGYWQYFCADCAIRKGFRW